MRAISSTKFNRTGDLLFSTARENAVIVWSTGFGDRKVRRLGRYMGHDGAVDGCDVTFDSRILATASGEGLVKLWDVESGQEARSIKTIDDQPARCVSFSHSAETIQVVLKPAFGLMARLVTYDPRDHDGRPLQSFEWSQPITHSEWGPTSDQIYLSTEESNSASMIIYDVRAKKLQLEGYDLHTGGIRKFAWLPDYSGLITASSDRSAHLVEADQLKIKKTYKTGEPLNAVAVHPTRPHVLLGGGTAAQNVAGTSAGGQRFLSRFFHTVFETETCTIGGHFSPVNSVNFHPLGEGFVTGGEDGIIKMYQFDARYKSIDDETCGDW